MKAKFGRVTTPPLEFQETGPAPTRPPFKTGRSTGPDVIPAAAAHSFSAAKIQDGIGTVRMRLLDLSDRSRPPRPPTSLPSSPWTGWSVPGRAESGAACHAGGLAGRTRLLVRAVGIIHALWLVHEVRVLSIRHRTQGRVSRLLATVGLRQGLAGESSCGDWAGYRLPLVSFRWLACPPSGRTRRHSLPPSARTRG